MTNPNPKNQFEKGRPRPANSGRKPGKLGARTELLSQALLLAAEEIGDVIEEPILNAKGKMIGVKLTPSGEGGLVAFLKWAALNHTAAYMSQLGKVMPLQVNVKAEEKRSSTMRQWRSADRP